MPVHTEHDIADLITGDSDLLSRIFKRKHEAESRVREVLGKDDADVEVYDLLVTEGDAGRVARLRMAEATFSVAISLPTLGLKPSEVGGIVTSIGMGEGRHGLASPADLRSHAGALFSSAGEDLSNLRDSYLVDTALENADVLWAL